MTQEEKFQIKTLEKISYMKPVLERVNKKMQEVGPVQSLDYVHDILRDSQSDIEKLLDERVKTKEIVDKAQARKSIAGAAFSNIIQYIFLKCKEANKVRENIYITNRTSNPIFENMVTIHIDEETQKPDMDLIIYSLDHKGSLIKCMIISLKTSLRERAGQTYKWKLLLEIATDDNNIRKKFNIRYDSKKMPLVCFATVNFYNEINSPQHRGMFKFFDSSFIGKPVETTFVKSLSKIIDYVNTNL